MYMHISVHEFSITNDIESWSSLHTDNTCNWSTNYCTINVMNDTMSCIWCCKTISYTSLNKMDFKMQYLKREIYKKEDI